MDLTLAATAILMGLAGGPHCVAMCCAACAGIGRTQSGQSTRALWVFQAGRLLGYSALGALAAASMQGLGWLSVHSAAFRPVWTLFHVSAAMLGLMLLWQARQPIWLENTARKIWHGVRSITGNLKGNATLAPIGLMGVLWALRVAVFRAVGGSHDQQCRSGCGCHGSVCTGQRHNIDGRTLALAAFARAGLWPMGHTHRGSGAAGQLDLGAVDGAGPQHRALVLDPLNCLELALK